MGVEAYQANENCKSSPAEWSAIWSEEHAAFYYYNIVSRVTTWEKPEGYVHKR